MDRTELCPAGRSGALRALGLVIPLLFSLLTGGCFSTRRSDFGLLYYGRATVRERAPLIVIPGVMGSRLVRHEGGTEVWPGRLPALLNGHSFRALALPESAGDQLVPGGLFDQLGTRSYYRDLVDALETYGHYRCASPETIGLATDCVLLDWDWRQDLVTAARRLEEVIESLRRLRLDPELEVDVIAHSAGGLVARYYLSYGGHDVLATDSLPPPDPDARGIDRLILIGTPNFGSIGAVQSAMFGSRFPLGRVGPEVLSSFPGLPQLFPHPRLDWMIEPDGLPALLNLFAISTWRDHHLGLFAPKVGERLRRLAESPGELSLAARQAAFEHALVRGERFQRALAVPLESSRVGIFVFGSACVATPARCLLERDAEGLVLRRRPEDIRHPIAGVDYRARMLEPGDGSVTKSSLLGIPSLIDGRPGLPLFPIAASVFVCAPHAGLSSNRTFLDNLFHVLLYREARRHPSRPSV